jgi:hypothetical protein
MVRIFSAQYSRHELTKNVRHGFYGVGPLIVEIRRELWSVAEVMYE